LLKDGEIIVERLLNDCWTIVERMLDCSTIVETL